MKINNEKNSTNTSENVEVILSKVFYNKIEYREVSINGEIMYFKENKHHKFDRISKETYDVEALGAIKVEDAKKTSNGLFSKVKSVFVAFILATAITSQVTGCSNDTTNNKPLVTTTMPTHIPSAEEKMQLTDLTLEDLPKYGIEVEALPTSRDNYSEYYIKSIDTSKLPNTTILGEIYKENGKKFNYVDNVSVPDVDFSKVEENINNSKIDAVYKKALIQAVQEILALGNEKLSKELLYNMSRLKIKYNPNHPAAETDVTNPSMIIGNLKLGSSDEIIAAVKSTGATEEHIAVLKEYIRYILTHECCHAATLHYNPITGEDKVARRAFLAIDNDTHKVLFAFQRGGSVVEAQADYLQYEVTKIPSNQYMGYSITTTLYTALFDMLGINTIDQVADLDVVKLIEIAGEESMLDIANIIDAFDSITQSTLSSFYVGNNIDYTETFCALLGSYIRSEQAKGTSTEDIINMLDKIEKDINDRVLITYEDGDNCVYGSFNLEFIDVSLGISAAKEYVYELENEKVNNYTK